MSEKEKAVESFKNRAKHVMALNAPILPAGTKITIADADRYTLLKKNIQDKMFAISAPLLDDKEKWEVILSMEEELDRFVNDAGTK